MIFQSPDKFGIRIPQLFIEAFAVMLARASTSWTHPSPSEDVDGRDKPDHDGEVHGAQE